MDELAKKYTEVIEQLRSKPVNYAQLHNIWINVARDRFTRAARILYGEGQGADDLINLRINVDVAMFRQSLSDEEYYRQLDEMHKDAVAVATRQLEHQRDNPGKANEPAPDPPAGDQIGTTVFTYIIAIAAYIGKSILGNVVANIDGAKNEKRIAAQALRASLGIGVSDMEKHGILGGDNSFIRRIIPTWSDDGGLFGGPNSVFRKPFG